MNRTIALVSTLIGLPTFVTTNAHAQVCDTSGGFDCAFLRVTGSPNANINAIHAEDVTTGSGSVAFNVFSVNGKAVTASAPKEAIWAQTHGSSSTTPAVFGFSNTVGIGIKGESSSGSGVFGSSTSGNGVDARSINNSGLFAVSQTGFAVAALSTSNNAISATSGQTDAIVGTGGSSSGAAGVHGISNGSNGWALYGTGNIKIVANGSQTGTATKPGGGSWIAPSDARIKKDVVPFTAGLSELAAVRPVRYKYNGLGGTRDDGTEYVGVIAQELEKAIPSMVFSQKTKLRSGDASEIDLKQVDPNAFTYALINSVNQLAAKNDELQRRLDRLEAHRPAIAGMTADGTTGAAGVGLGLGLAFVLQGRRSRR